MSNSDIELEKVKKRVLDWMQFLHMTTQKRLFTISDAKHKFLTLSNILIERAFELLVDQKRLDVDRTLRVKFYRFIPKPPKSVGEPRPAREILTTPADKTPKVTQSSTKSTKSTTPVSDSAAKKRPRRLEDSVVTYILQEFESWRATGGIIRQRDIEKEARRLGIDEMDAWQALTQLNKKNELRIGVNGAISRV